MNRFTPGDLIRASDTFSRVTIWNDIPKPSAEQPKEVGKMTNTDVGLVIYVIDKQHLYILSRGSVGVVLSATVKNVSA